jgi:UDP-glucose 4-epimerase
MFGGEIDMLPERKGNRMIADIITDKTKALGWKPTKIIKDYIEELKINNWQ